MEFIDRVSVSALWARVQVAYNEAVESGVVAYNVAGPHSVEALYEWYAGKLQKEIQTRPALFIC